MASSGWRSFRSARSESLGTQRQRCWLAVVLIVAAILRVALGRYPDRDAEARAASGWPALSVGAGVLVGALLIGYAAQRGVPHWQSIPSTWDSVWHANWRASIFPDCGPNKVPLRKGIEKLAGKYVKYKPEFRDEVARLVIETSRSIADVSREYGLNETTVGGWVKKYRASHAADEPPLELSDRAWLGELERRNRELEMENAFLKKASAYV